MKKYKTGLVIVGHGKHSSNDVSCRTDVKAESVRYTMQNKKFKPYKPKCINNLHDFKYVRDCLFGTRE